MCERKKAKMPILDLYYIHKGPELSTIMLISEISNLDFDMIKLVITIIQDKGFVPAVIHFTLIGNDMFS